MDGSAEQRLEFQSGALTLEGMLRLGDAHLAAVVLHPHPEYGGDMNNHVVTSICETLGSLGATTLRFNTRGAGRSEGRYDHGKGEREDALAAVTLMRDAAPDARFALVGYSFGAVIAASIVDDVNPTGVVLVSPPTQNSNLAAFDGSVPALMITGERDTVSSPAVLAPLAGPLRQVIIVAGADHGWWPGIDRLSAEVSAFVKKL